MEHIPINPKDYPDPKSLSVGSVLKVPHMGCSESSAMKLTATVEGVHYYCFKCGSSKFISGNYCYRDRKAREAENAALMKERMRTGFDLPEDFSQDIPSAGLAWLGLGGWTSDMISRYKVGWSDNLKRVVIPIQPQGYTARAVFPDQLPKYLEKAPALSWWESFPVWDNPIMAVTEDILSAGRVGEFIYCHALNGTTAAGWLPPEGFEHVMIWLDGDKAGREGMLKLLNRLQWAYTVTIVTTDKDPKLYSRKEMYEIICSKLTKHCSNCSKIVAPITSCGVSSTPTS
jgi:hypothetical protein